jgi:glutaredoxin-like protein
MPLIPEKDQELLKNKFAKDLSGPVTITLFTQYESTLTVPGQECMYCRETRELLEELTGLSDKLTLETYDLVKDNEKAKQFSIERIPAIILGDGTKPGVRYFGIPSGYEFASLIEDLVDVSRNDTDLPPDVKTELDSITDDVHLQVFVTPT